MDSEVLAEKLYETWAEETPALRAPSGAYWTPRSKRWLELSPEERTRWRSVAGEALLFYPAIPVEDYHGKSVTT